MNSPNSADNEFLIKLTEITEANLTNPQFGVSMLAKELGMSRYNLYRKVNEITKITVSQLINQIRLKKAKEILRHTSNTVSVVAYEVGFNNVSYFIKCFHEFYGYPPGEVGQRDAKEDDSDSQLFTRKKRLTKILISVVSILVLAIALLLIFKPIVFKSNRLEKSIAVLPLIDDSPEEGNSHVINGLREDILNNLEKIGELRVVSRTTAEKYKDSKLSAKEIAKELNVNYILEGSGQKVGNRIKIFFQLIEARIDNPLWSDSYTREINDDNTFEIQEEVAFAVARNINAKITPEEAERIKKVPTKNPVAQEWYYKGLDLANKGEKENLENAISFLKKAIENDNEFALAYAELALTYYFLNNWEKDNKYTKEISDNAEMAILYDSQLDKSLIAKALVCLDRRERQTAIRYLEKALEYNPNSHLATKVISTIYIWGFPDMEKSLEYSLRLIKLSNNIVDSVTYDDYVTLGYSFRESGFLEEAEKCFNLVLQVYPNSLFAAIGKLPLLREGKIKSKEAILMPFYNKDSTDIHLLRCLGSINYINKDYSQAYKYYSRMFEINNTAFIEDCRRMGFICSKLGKNVEAEKYFNVFFDYDKNQRNPVRKFHGWAEYYAFKGDTKNSLKQMKLFSQLDNYPYSYISSWKTDPMLENIRNLPEYKELLIIIETKFRENHERIKANLTEKGLLPIKI